MARASSNSARANDFLSRRDLLVLAVAVLVGGIVFIVSSRLTYRIGFPLDDSWIHQTYARNLALHGQWAFRLGEPSGGSTAPLWSALLAVGYWLRLAPYSWTYLIGGITHFALAVAAESAARRMVPAYRPGWPWVGLFMALEWHLLWSAVSGMETLLHALILMVVSISLMTGSRRYLALGLLTGASVWIRPDGLTLLGPVILTLLLTEKNARSRLNSLTLYLIGFGSLFLLYLLFNLVIGGVPMPNTFYAKQAEYAAWQARPLPERLVELTLQLLAGPLVFLLPAVIGWGVVSFRRRAWGTLSVMLWAAGYIGLYITRLPVYQHGRYVMPVMPELFLFGLLGLAEFSKSELPGRRLTVLRTAWQASVASISAGFLLLGALVYSGDVALIESEMVATARWARRNVPSGSLIAAHDIGALGYFDDHELLDLAGLISPEVVPFIRDEARLAEFLDERGAEYLIAFPGFYPQLTRRAQPIYSTGGEFAPRFGGKNMVVYRWESP